MQIKPIPIEDISSALEIQNNEVAMVIQTQRISFRQRVRRLLQNSIFLTVNSLLTAFALFGDDLKYIVANDS
jgi:hypothetical protein